ncbi:MAG TPA: hypothetical protein VH309_01200 [Elusimicrobiota bacterium]|nr:hypothetical protein [Elusimicrobiota bacterium]
MTSGRAALVLLLALLGSARARADAFDDADRTLSGLESRAGEIAAPRLAGRYSSEADCLARFDLDALMRAATSDAMISDLSRQMDPVVQYSFRYYTCVAAASGDDSVCGRLAAFDHYAAPHPRLECLRYSKELIYIRALMTGAPNLRALCRADLTHPEDNEFRSEDIDPVCSIMLADYRRPAEACGKLTHYFIKPSQPKKCRAWLGSLLGDEAGCRALGDNDVRERCFSYAYFHKALETGDVKDCRGSAICEMFLGGGATSCGSYTRRIATHVCRFQPERNARLAEERAGLAADIQKAEEDFKSLPSGPAADARRRRLELVRRRLGTVP